MTDIVKDLRELSDPNGQIRDVEYWLGRMEFAADEIELLRSAALDYAQNLGQQTDEIERLRADKAELVEALDYVCERTTIGRDAEWHFKVPYDPQIVVDLIAKHKDQSDD